MVAKLAALIYVQLKTNRFLTKMMHITVATLVVLAFSTIFFAPTLNANIYSWTDSDGVKHFSNVPPPPDNNSIVNVKRAYEYDKEADEQRWKLEKEEWDSLEQKLKEMEQQEAAANEAAAKKRVAAKSLDEKAELEKHKLQSEIERLERTPARSFPEQLNGKRAALSYYRARLKTLEDDPEVYFYKP